MNQPRPGTPQPAGLGDVIAAGTTALGVKPCGSCLRRKAALNAATPGWLRRTITACLGWLERRRGKRRS
jgi:hypothetical protein